MRGMHIPASMALFTATGAVSNFVVHVQNGGAGRIVNRWIKLPLKGASSGQLCIEYKGAFLPLRIEAGNFVASTTNKVAEPMTVKGTDYRGIRIDEVDDLLKANGFSPRGTTTVAAASPTPSAISLVPSTAPAKAPVTAEKAVKNAEAGLRLAVGTLAKDPNSATAQKRVESATLKVAEAKAAYFAQVGGKAVAPVVNAMSKAEVIAKIEELSKLLTA